jgi:alpha-amylase
MRNSFIISLLSLLSMAACQSIDNSKSTSAPKSMSVVRSEYPSMPDWAKNAVLYEVNTRNFSAAGNFAGVTAQLPRLRDMGIDVIWLMPIHPIGKERRKGSLGSPYSARDFKAVHPDYGTEADLRQLVKKAHELGLKVILDWVPNHTSWDAVWKQQHPEYYTKYNGDFTVPLNEHGQPIDDWSDICDLDYGNPATRRAMIDAMQYWVRSCDIDGFRCDMAGLVPNDFWAEARPALDSIKPLYMLSEWQDEPGHFRSCFHTNYGWKWKDVTKDIWAGKQNAIALDTLLTFLNEYYPREYHQLYFTQNHDENTWSGTEYDLYGASSDAFNVLAFTWQGLPMIYCGQEDALSQRIKFFDRDPIHWKNNYVRAPFFKTLCDLKHNSKALRAGSHGGALEKLSTSDDEKIYAFSREKDGDRVIVILNLHKTEQRVTVQLPSKMAGAYSNMFGSNTIQVTNEMQLSLKPWEYLVLSKS